MGDRRSRLRWGRARLWCSTYSFRIHLRWRSFRTRSQSSASRRAGATQRSAIEFARGLRGGVRRTSVPSAASTESKAAANLASRSRITKRGRRPSCVSCQVRLRACCVSQPESGLSVQAAKRMRRLTEPADRPGARAVQVELHKRACKMLVCGQASDRRQRRAQLVGGAGHEAESLLRPGGLVRRPARSHEHGPGRDSNATLTKQLGYLPGGERVAQVPTDRGDDHLRWPTVAREGAAGSMGEVSMTEMAGEALPAAAVETITRCGGLVAGRAGGHRSTVPRAPHDFADSSQAAGEASHKRPRRAGSRHAALKHKIVTLPEPAGRQPLT